MRAVSVKKAYLSSQLASDWGTISRWANTHILIHLASARSLQITLSSQSYENWAHNLSFNTLLCGSEIQDICWFFFFKLATWKQKKLSWKLSMWFLVTTEPFRINWKYNHNDIMRRLPSDRYKHSLKVGAMGKPGDHGCLWLSTYGEIPFRQINKNTDKTSLWLMVFAGN